MASKSEPSRHTITVLGRIDMNSPLVPEMSSIGMKAAMVVAMAAVTGHITSSVPFTMASVSGSPSSTCR